MSVGCTIRSGLQIFPADQPAGQTAALGDLVDVRAGVLAIGFRGFTAVQISNLLNGRLEVSVDDLGIADADLVRDGLLLQALASIAKSVGLLRAQCAGVSSLGVTAQCSRYGGSTHMSPWATIRTTSAMVAPGAFLVTAPIAPAARHAANSISSAMAV